MNDLEQFGDILESQIKQLKDEIKQLERFRDDLKCCGNCLFNNYLYYNNYRNESCSNGKDPDCSGNYCPYWQFDGMRQKDRKIE